MNEISNSLFILLITSNKFFVSEWECVESCQQREDLKYEHYSQCYEKCPEGTHISTDNEKFFDKESALSSMQKIESNFIDLSVILFSSEKYLGVLKIESNKLYFCSL